MPKLPKTERLYGQKVIDSLFKNGEKWACYPFRVVLEITETRTEASPVRFLVSVGKKNFKRAVDRNLLKRRVREAYRLHKHRLLDTLSLHSSELENKKLVIGFLYSGKLIEPFDLIEKRLIRALDEIVDRIGDKKPLEQ